MRVGNDFSIKFTDFSLEMCSSEVGFSKKNDSTFICSESLDFADLAQVIKLKMKVEYDSVVVCAGYENRYGILYSETEGAYIYDGNETEAIHFSGWRRAEVLDANRKYSLKFFGYGKGFVNNDPPEMTKKAVTNWCKTLEWCPADKPVSVFCAKMIICVTIHLNGQARNYYLNFDRRVGEC